MAGPFDGRDIDELSFDELIDGEPNIAGGTKEMDECIIERVGIGKICNENIKENHSAIYG